MCVSFAAARRLRVNDRVTISAAAADAGLGLDQDWYIESITHSLQGAQHTVAYELSSPITFPPPALGVIYPTIVHFNATAPQLTRLQAGYNGAIADAIAWFNLHVGEAPTAAATTTLNGSTFGETLASVQADAWAKCQGLLTSAGTPPWQANQLRSVLVMGMPYTTPGLGGASTDEGTTGLVVKDGDCLELFAKKHVDGTGFLESDYQINLAMLIHELLHGMAANSHEDISGFNVEWEWWEGANNVIIAPINKQKLLAGIWVD